ncbi:THO complex subunit 6 homolog [Ciona intestinalis]
MDKRHLLHTTVYSTAFSLCGTYVAAATNFGHIAVFNVQEAVASHCAESTPYFTFLAHNGPIHSLVTAGKYLFSAGDGPITAWKWADVINRKPTKAFTLKDPQLPENESYNCVRYSHKDNCIFAGGDDGITYKWDINTMKCKSKFSGHKDYIHDLAINSNNLISASEDGTVKTWDIRSASCTSTITPNKNKQLARPETGHFMSCVAVDENGEWLACGGGPHASLWHLRSKSMAGILKTSNTNYISHRIMFYNDEIISVGNQPAVYRWSVNGEKKAEIPCSINRIFSINFQHGPGHSSEQLPMVTAGNSYKLSMFTNLGYEGKQLSFV